MGRVISGTKQEESIEVSKYIAGRNYKWEPEDEFVLTGEEFSTLVNTLILQATVPGGAPPISIVNSHKILEDLLIKGVEAGIIHENTPMAPTGPMKSTDVIEGIPLP